MKKNECIVIGMGRLGTTIAKKLNKIGYNVTIIDKNAETFEYMEDFSGFMINDDATDLTVLENNGVRDVDTIIITTNDDNTNIFIAHVCKKLYNIPNIYCRIADTDKNILLQDYGIKIINPFSLCLDYFNELLGE